MDHVAVALLNGLVVGASLALVAAGLALIYGVFDVLNLAQGDFFMLGGYVAWLTVGAGANFWLGAVAATVLVGLFGGLLLLAMVWPIRDRSHALVLLATLALGLVLQQLAANVFGGDPKPVEPPIEGRLAVGSTLYPLYHLAVVAIAVAVLGGGFGLLQYTRCGIWTRATAQDREMASVLGIPVPRVYALAFVVSAALAGLAGALLVPLTGVHPAIGLDVTLNAFVVVIAGGAGNVRGAAIIALLLGVLESLAALALPAQAIQLLVSASVITLLAVRSRRRLLEAPT